MPPPRPPTPAAAHLDVLRLIDSGDLQAAARLAAAARPSSPVSLAAVLLRHPPPRLGYCIHARAARGGLLADRYLANALLSFYVRLPRHLPHALRAFDDLPRRDVVAHSSILAAFLRAGMPRRALASLRSMLAEADDVSPNAHAFSAAVKACSVLRDRNAGACLHGSILVRGFGDDDIVLSALVDMYGHASAPSDAQKAFEEMRAPDGICYTSLISAFVRNDWFEEAVRWFRSMLMMNGVRPDGCTFGSMMTALGNLKRENQGRQAHAQVVTRGLCGNVIVESSTLDMYAKCGSMVEARKVFDRMLVRNEVSWCALLGGYCQNGEYEKVVALFREMDKKDGDWYSLGTVLRACAGLSSVKPGKEIHCRFLRMGGWRDVVVESALVDLYAKCGAVDYAYTVFEASTVRNTITWNAMIGGFAQNGHGERAINLFDRMVREGPRPDYISFVSVLFACSHTGMVEQGRKYFNSMSNNYTIAPGIEHYNCMVDLLSRVELLEEAEDLINKSPFRGDSSLWAAILGASATHSNPDVAERVAKKMMELQPQYHLSYVLLENVYRTVGRWEDALEIRRLMESRKVKKEPGMSWIDANRSKLCVGDVDEAASASELVASKEIDIYQDSAYNFHGSA
ncbi:pentatricopeptide repeat-containing protein At1g03540 [Oryza brachyantha]|uniref:EMB2261 putative n=2 Tax=Oryza brachyantha TaxID=4533 RepID=C0JAE5_ORYBR|nr:pentatricopeptide repeat-containing protein At1g03540 [Oryza brachyantha]XP_040380689.1 pentatricopeptide repeat-containing protein At1g03540 [Oryza brachyantha]XP_040380690.1 pentatricopeptide repeat-containing protein At1g03540 [Oryza brachyantha]XP_040380691.1 pentatricopeptide repeat-containing protein At1g03540 [Oryza brachyantha]XP_040380692.1 pentatricopeptide repeat-containing protein At1g03540 [Oryza brachyantha]ACN85326.1 EMB2261 putative [Oryza brachyantha]